MEREKKVDESWKDAVGQEKDLSKSGEAAAPETEAGPEGEMEMNFLNYLTSLVMQALIFLGEIPNPMAENKVEVNLRQAKFLIDTLLLLRDKTKGNLSKEEDGFLNMALYELQMKFVERSNGGHQLPDTSHQADAAGPSKIIQP